MEENPSGWNGDRPVRANSRRSRIGRALIGRNHRPLATNQLLTLPVATSSSYRPEAMAVLVVQYEASDTEHRIGFDPAAAPFERHGRPGSVLDVMLGHGLWLEHA